MTDSPELATAKQILANQSQPAFAEPEPAPVAGFDLDALIAQARERLSLPIATAPAAGKLEAPDADLVSALLARADDFKRVSDEAIKEREKITAFLADLIVAAEESTGTPIEELTVHGATVFTYKTVTSRVLNQTHLKSLFPDIPTNAEAWKDQTARKPAGFEKWANGLQVIDVPPIA